jgi:ABC-type dipeptide/oligopeptide/nickel transport system ATPase component
LKEDIILNIEDLSVAFDTESGMIHAVDKLSFELKHGSNLGIVGESGCGKVSQPLVL